MKVIILGAGPAGLGLAHRLLESGKVDVHLIESQAQIGGLAQTIPWKDYGTHDLGPHKLFTLNKDVEKSIKTLIPESGWLTQPKVSRIYLKGHYLPYPPSPFSLINVYGPFKFLLMGLDYAFSLMKSMILKGKDDTFEADLVSRVGRRMYEALFKPIAVKLWGDPTTLDSKLSKGRVQTPSLSQLLLKSAGVKKATQTSEALTFFYPKGGLQKMWEPMLQKLPKENLKLNHDVTGLVMEGRRVKSISLKNKTNNKEETMPVGQGDLVVSTIPIKRAVEFLFPEDGNELAREVDETVSLNDLILVFLKINQPKMMKDSWIFIPDPSIPFHRVSEQASFDPGMTPKGSIVCCEMMSYPERPLMKASDTDLIAQAKKGLHDMSLMKDGNQIVDARVIRLPKTYPVYKKGSYDRLKDIMDILDQFENFRSVGRQGSFNYIGSLDAVDIGYGTADWILQTSNWADERERTSHFPVLD